MFNYIREALVYVLACASVSSTCSARSVNGTNKAACFLNHCVYHDFYEAFLQTFVELSELIVEIDILYTIESEDQQHSLIMTLVFIRLQAIYRALLKEIAFNKL